MWIGVIRILTQTNICSKSRWTSTAALSGMTDAWPAVTLLFCCLHLISELFCNPSNRQKWLCRSVVGCDFFFFFHPQTPELLQMCEKIATIMWHNEVKWNGNEVWSHHFLFLLAYWCFAAWARLLTNTSSFHVNCMSMVVTKKAVFSADNFGVSWYLVPFPKNDFIISSQKVCSNNFIQIPNTGQMFPDYRTFSPFNECSFCTVMFTFSKS